MNVFRMDQRRWNRPATPPMSPQCPQEKRLTTQEVPPELLRIAVPQFFAKDSTAQRPPKQPPQDHLYRVVQPDQHGGSRPDDVAGDAVVTVSDPSVTLQFQPQPFSEHIVRCLRPIRPMPEGIELYMRNVERSSNPRGHCRLTRAGGTDKHDTVGTTKVSSGIRILRIGHIAREFDSGRFGLCQPSPVLLQASRRSTNTHESRPADAVASLPGDRCLYGEEKRVRPTG